MDPDALGLQTLGRKVRKCLRGPIAKNETRLLDFILEQSLEAGRAVAMLPRGFYAETGIRNHAARRVLAALARRQWLVMDWAAMRFELLPDRIIDDCVRMFPHWASGMPALGEPGPVQAEAAIVDRELDEALGELSRANAAELPRSEAAAPAPARQTLPAGRWADCIDPAAEPPGLGGFDPIVQEAREQGSVARGQVPRAKPVAAGAFAQPLVAHEQTKLALAGAQAVRTRLKAGAMEATSWLARVQRVALPGEWGRFGESWRKSIEAHGAAFGERVWPKYMQAHQDGEIRSSALGFMARIMRDEGLWVR